MGTKKLVWTVLVVAVIVAAAIVLVRQDRGGTQGPETHKVGAVFTLTGKLAYWSTHLKDGADLALQEVNEGGAVPIEIVYEDVRGQQQAAVAALQKLDQIDKVSVAVSCFTPISQPLRPLAEDLGLPLLATVTSAHQFALGYKWSFRDFPTQDQMALPLGRYAKESMELETAASFVVNDDYGRDGAEQFQTGFEEAGGRWLGSEVFEQAAVDVRAPAAKVASLSPQGVIIVGRGQSLALAIKQLRESGFEGQIFSVNSLESPDVWAAAGPAVEGAIFASADVDFERSPEAKAFKARFTAKYNRDPDYVDVYGYTITQYLTALLRETGGDRDAMRQALGHLNVASIRGNLLMNADHDVLSPIAFYRVSKATKVPVR